MNRPNERTAPEAVPERSKSVVETHDQGIAAGPLTHSEVLDALPAYALIVRTGTGRLNRKLFLSLHAAVKATERAQQRGHAASLEMVRISPVTGRDGGRDA